MTSHAAYTFEIASPSMMTGLPPVATTILMVPLRTLAKFAIGMTWRLRVVVDAR